MDTEKLLRLTGDLIDMLGDRCQQLNAENKKLKTSVYSYDPGYLPISELIILLRLRIGDNITIREGGRDRLVKLGYLEEYRPGQYKLTDLGEARVSWMQGRVYE